MRISEYNEALFKLRNAAATVSESIYGVRRGMTGKVSSACDSVLEAFSYVSSLCGKYGMKGLDGMVSECVLLENACKDMCYVSGRMNMLCEGFQSIEDLIDMPDDDDSDENVEETDVDPVPVNNGVSIVGVGLRNTNVSQKVEVPKSAGYAVAGRRFCEGDVVEVSPVRMLSRSDLYSATIRDMAFRISDDSDMYCIPFGYVSYYSNSNETREDPNIRYEVVGSGGDYYIVMYATTDIRPGGRLIIGMDGERYENTFVDGDFDYSYPNPDIRQIDFR